MLGIKNVSIGEAGTGHGVTLGRDCDPRGLSRQRELWAIVLLC